MIPSSTQRPSEQGSQTRNYFRQLTYTREPEPIKEKKSSGIKTAFSGLISTIERFTSTTRLPPQPITPLHTPQRKTTQPELRKYSRERKLLLPQLSRNLETRLTHQVVQEPHLVAQRPQQVHRPYKQVRFLEQPS